MNQNIHGSQNVHMIGYTTGGFDPHRKVKRTIESYYEKMEKDPEISLRIEIV